MGDIPPGRHSLAWSDGERCHICHNDAVASGETESIDTGVGVMQVQVGPAYCHVCGWGQGLDEQGEYDALVRACWERQFVLFEHQLRDVPDVALFWRQWLPYLLPVQEHLLM